MEARAVVLAAGKSKRMKTTLPKVLHRLCGRPLIDYVVDALREVGLADEDICFVVGFGADQVRQYLEGIGKFRYALQEQQLGTGHAVACARDFLAAGHGPVFVLAGDMPLIRGSSLAALMEAFRHQQAACAIGTAEVPDPTGLGRVVRASDGTFERIVEEIDATEEERQICEINTSIYVFDTAALLTSLEALRPDNRQGELYLTDCPTVIQRAGGCVIAARVFSPEEAVGVNSRAELARAHRLMQQRIHAGLMASGVTILDPDTVYVDGRAKIGPDTTIHPMTYIDGPCQIGTGCEIGPMAYVPPGTVLEPGSRWEPGRKS